MGTNYYYEPANSVCSECGRSDEPLHIGKSSAGWVFALHVIPEKNILGLEDWKSLWQQNTGTIVNEYNKVMSQEEMLEIITDRSWLACTGFNVHTSEFMKRNHAAAGPKGLLRSQIGRYCVAHGEGTWDLHEGEFS